MVKSFSFFGRMNPYQIEKWMPTTRTTSQVWKYTCVCVNWEFKLYISNSSQNFNLGEAISTEIQTYFISNGCHHKQIDFCRFAKRIKNRFYAGSTVLSVSHRIVFRFFSLFGFVCVFCNQLDRKHRCSLYVIRDAEYHGPFFRQSFAWLYHVITNSLCGQMNDL